MLELDDELKALTQKLSEERDRLKVRLHLARAEVRDEWQEIEKKWEHFQGKARLVRDQAAEAAEDAASAARLLGEEIERGFEKIRRAL